MEIGSLLLGAALLVLVGLFLARPFILSDSERGKQRSMRQELLTQKEAILARIEVLEFDYETGTLPEMDYKQQRRQLVAEAAEILQKIEELPAVVPAKIAAAKGNKVDSEIEAAVARLRQRPPQKVQPRPASPPPKAPVPAVSETVAPTNGRVKYCSQCGQAVEESDNFCAYCGHKVHHPQPS